MRRHGEVREHFRGFAKPLAVLLLFAGLLLVQPDLGSVVVMFVTTVGMLFMAGAKLWQFIALLITGLTLVAGLIIAEPYRVRRVTAFFRPLARPVWERLSADPIIDGIWARRLVWARVGKFDSKVRIFAGSPHRLCVCCHCRGTRACRCESDSMFYFFSSSSKRFLLANAVLNKVSYSVVFLAFGIGIWFAFQTMVNVGAAAGMLPTKGLTLPLISYGGSSLVIMAVAVALLLRIDHEYRLATSQAHQKTPYQGKNHKYD